MGSGLIELIAYLFSPAATEPCHPEVLLSKLRFSSCLHRFFSCSSVHCLGHATLALHEFHSALEVGTHSAAKEQFRRAHPGCWV